MTTWAEQGRRWQVLCRMVLAVLAVFTIRLVPEIAFEVGQAASLGPYDEVLFGAVAAIALIAVLIWQLVACSLAWMRTGFYGALGNLFVATVVLIVLSNSLFVISVTQYVKLRLLPERFEACERVGIANPFGFAVCESRIAGDFAHVIVFDKDARLQRSGESWPPEFRTSLLDSRDERHQRLATCRLTTTRLAAQLYLVGLSC